MVRTLIALILSCGMLTGVPAQAAIQLGNATFPDSITVDGAPLQLNGAGIRSKVFFHVYAIGLYLPQPTTQAEAALTSTPPRALRIQLLRSLSGATFADALIEGLKQNQPQEALTPYQASIDTLRQAILSQSEYKENSVVVIREDKNGMVHITVEEKPLVAPIAQPGFFSLLLSIWLGPKPVQDSLKNELLKGSAS
ncbi:chalcone isomerase family protein [Hydrogenophilus thiooxidans]|uniref:chalcone isomerase family protein n=1 Tax=Hydrogenophilus thiooxidans TaxID=2820326 RepID=UPI001C214F19|nr:chalcone isomerase family protein [Hydrogenophilus thiooxidans]